MAVKMMHCCFDRTGRRIRSTERKREVKIGGEYYITESRRRRRRDMGMERSSYSIHYFTLSQEIEQQDAMECLFQP